MPNFACLFLIYMLITYDTNFVALDKIYERKEQIIFTIHELP